VELPRHWRSAIRTLDAVSAAGTVLHLSIPVDDLGAARSFYVEAFGCRVGREREEWIDIWFFGMQLTLQLRPDEVRPLDEQGVRHFGVVLGDAKAYLALVDQLDAAGVEWLSAPTVHDADSLSGKVGGKVADPSGNVIEVKYYDDVVSYAGPTSSSADPS
jgi:extradiol dioxygenase family protein